MSDINAHITEAQAADTGGQGTVKDYFALLKPRVMSLVIFTAFVGIIAAPGTLHPWLAFVALLAIAVGAGAAGMVAGFIISNKSFSRQSTLIIILSVSLC